MSLAPPPSLTPLFPLLLCALFAMDYKNTLKLPRTDFAMKADLVTREPERLKKWEAAGLYAQIQAARAGGEKFVLHDGRIPPTATCTSARR